MIFIQQSLNIVSFYIKFQSSMSVKLPLIIKRQIKPQPRKHTQPLEEEQEPKKIEPEEEDYDDDEFEEQPSEEPPQPVQTFTVLKQAQPHVNQLEVSLVSQKQEKVEVHVESKQHQIEELQRILQEKIQLVGTLKENLVEKKKELKNIGEQIDKDLNKTLLKTNKANTVNIRDIFSAPPKTNNKKLNELNQELKTVRFSIKKVKQEITKLSEGLNDPVIVLNQQKGIQFENRIKNQQEDIKHIEKQKVILGEEIARGGKQINQEEEKQKNDQIVKLQATLAELNNSQKELKANIYLIEKEDILLMEKVNFFQSREGGLGQTKKNKPTQKQRLKLDEQIRQLIEEVNETIQERNKIQNEKKSNLKNLINQIASVQSKNWDLCNRLREIDSFLLQYYEKKSKKKQAKQIKNISEKPQKESQPVISKSVSGRIEAESIYSQTPIKTIQYENDKNKKAAEIVLVQKKKNYDFSEKVSQSELNISDEFLGTKLNLNKLILTVDEEKLYSIKVTYEINSKDTVEGYLMGSKNPPANSSKIQINFDRQFLQIINFLHVGHGQDHCVSFFHVITTQGKQYKWGNIDKSAKSDQKHIKKYEFCHFKSKLLPLSSEESETPLFCVSGITLSTIYLSGK